jgi:glycosyltransferase involved in cell wall biosynthesis
MLGSRIGEWLQARALKRFDGVVAVSRVLAESLPSAGVPAERVHLIPNGWVREPVLGRDAARAALGLSDGRKVIGWIGRMIPVKAADVFVEALARLGGSDDWRAYLIGDGPERQACEDLARRLGVADRITFAGLVPGARRYVRALDVLALSSHSEGTPMTLLEAMAEEVPIVATEVGGVADLLGPDGGRLARAADPDGLAAALRAVLDHPAEAGAAAARARARMEGEYDGDTWAARHEEVYGRIARKRRPPSGG